METATPSLLELQCAMRASLVVHDDRGISAHVVDAGMSPAERLDVYRSTFASVLTKAVRLSYPAVHRIVGAEFFDGAARIFIEAHPPKSACLDDYGEKFADFLSDFERSEEHTSELQSRLHLVCRLLLEKKKKKHKHTLYSRSNQTSASNH